MVFTENFFKKIAKIFFSFKKTLYISIVKQQLNVETI